MFWYRERSKKNDFLGFDNEEDDAERVVVKIDDVSFLFVFSLKMKRTSLRDKSAIYNKVVSCLCE
jgi:hypothetical protein